MPTYNVTYVCGHEGQIEVTGDKRLREWKICNAERDLCPDCYRKKKFEESKAILTEAQTLGLPELTGTEKQVAWAASIRKAILAHITEGLVKYNLVTDTDRPNGIFLKPKPDHANKPRRPEIFIYYNLDGSGCKIPEIDQTILRNAVQAVHDKTSAHWWIESRQSNSLNGAFKLVIEEYRAIEQMRIEHGVVSAAELEVNKKKATISPENPVNKTVAEIIVEGSTIKVVYPIRSEKLRQIVKSKGFQWSGTSWKRTIGGLSGHTNDRAAEIGNALLNAGFMVCIMDETIRQKAIDADFAPEHHRWVRLSPSSDYKDWFYLVWEEGNWALYHTFKKIPGCERYGSYVLIPPRHYEAVLDAVEGLGFRFTKSAQEIIEKVKAANESVLLVKPSAAPSKPLSEDTVKTPIGEIDESLRDDY